MKKTLLAELTVRKSDCIVETKENIYKGYSQDLIDLITDKELEEIVTQKCKCVARDGIQWQLWTN